MRIAELLAQPQSLICSAVAGVEERPVYFRRTTKRVEESMVLIYENDPMDDEHAGGQFYHVCRGRIDRTPLKVPNASHPYACGRCGIDLDVEDFLMALKKGAV